MNERIDALWAKTLADPFNQAWPESLIATLNADPELEVSFGQRVREVVRVRGGSVRTIRIPDLTAIRQQLQELRTLVDRYLRGEDITTVVKALRAKLDQQSYRAVIAAPAEVSDRPVKKGAKAIMRFQPEKNPNEVRYDDWLGFARLLDDPLAERLRKCPECGKYFLADKRITKKFCSQECGWQNRRAEQVVKNPKAYLTKERERVKGYRQRKKQPTK